jgi:hypothetical protein
LIGAEIVDRVAIEKDAAARGREPATDQVEECSLPGAIRADDGVALARGDVKAYSANDLGQPEALSHVLELQGKW